MLSTKDMPIIIGLEYISALLFLSFLLKEIYVRNGMVESSDPRYIQRFGPDAQTVVLEV